MSHRNHRRPTPKPNRTQDRVRGKKWHFKVIAAKHENQRRTRLRRILHRMHRGDLLAAEDLHRYRKHTAWAIY
jgi:hypothetical protein